MDGRVVDASSPPPPPAKSLSAPLYLPATAVRGAATDRRTQTVPYPAHLPDIPASERAALDLAHSWHNRLNHPFMGTICIMARNLPAVRLPAILCRSSSLVPMHCSSCSVAHFQRAPHHGHSPRPPPGHTLVTDMAGPLGDGKSTPGRYRHFLTVTELATRMRFIYLMRSRSEAGAKIREAIITIERHFGHRVSRVRCDNASEYLSKELLSWYAERGTHVDPTVPDSPQENSISERLNRTLMARVRATINAAGLDFSKYWAMCLLDTVAKTNSILHIPTNTVPLLEWNKLRHERCTLPIRTPDLNQYRMFGELAYVPIRAAIKSKSAPRARLVRYLFTAPSGHYQTMDTQTGLLQLVRPQDYRPYNPKFDPLRVAKPPAVHERVLPRANQHYAYPKMACGVTSTPVARTDRPDHTSPPHRIFEQDKTDPETEYRTQTQAPEMQTHAPRDPAIPATLDHATQTQAVADPENKNLDTSGPRSSTEKDAPFHDYTAFSVYMDPMSDLVSTHPNAPQSLLQARDSPDAENWKEAFEREMQMHDRFGTFRYVDASSVDKPSLVPRAVVRFTHKLDSDGNVASYKARVAYPGHRLVCKT